MATAGGISADALTLGASLHSVRFPDAEGRFANVVLSPSQLADKLGAARYHGSTIGRYANRIAHGRLPTPSGTLQLSSNEGHNTLHGGSEGFDTRLWSALPLIADDRSGVRFRLVSVDGDQGFPGTLQATVTYSLSGDGELRIDYAATSDRLTAVNLTNHTYWNLAGDGEDTILDHDLRVAADHYTPVDVALIPLPGPPRPVVGTPFDLTQPRRLREVLNAQDEQLSLAGGFDHNWVLRRSDGEVPASAAVLSHPGSGRRLECLTTEPGLQVYTGNHFSGSGTDRFGFSPVRYAAMAIETQHFPDSPSRCDYPSTWLRPGDSYRSTSIFRFTTDSGCVSETEGSSSA